MPEQDLHGQRALVTGGTKGIGAATAALLERRGAHVIISGRNAPSEPLGSAEFIATDLTADDGPEQLAADVLRRWDRLDILIDNAGDQIVHDRVEDFTDADWNRDLQINLLAAVKLDRALLPALSRHGGAIVHVSSTVARTPEPAVLAYATAKAALAVYSKGLSKQVGAQGVRVNSIFPGFTATEMLVGRFQSEAQAHGQSYEEFIPGVMKQFGVALGRPADPAEVAAAIVFLASPAASYLTGAQLMVEGGVFPAIF